MNVQAIVVSHITHALEDTAGGHCVDHLCSFQLRDLPFLGRDVKKVCPGILEGDRLIASLLAGGSLERST